MHHLATVNVEGLTSDVFGMVGGQEGGHGGKLFWHLPAPEMGDFLDLSCSPFVEADLLFLRKVFLTGGPD